MGSRYGGLKQLDGLGPSGETILEYSVYDAIRAGFGKVVFVIRQEFEDAFRERISNRCQGRIEIRHAFQEIGKLPAPFQVPEGRTKPWGTGHAVLCAQEHISEPFAVINADDFYGRSAYATLAKFLTTEATAPGTPTRFCLIGYRLKNTLSEHGSVARGVCSVDPRGRLTGLVERTNITDAPGGPRHTEADGTVIPISPEALVSMNCFGFSTYLMERLGDQFREFLEKRGGEQKSEFYIPFAVNDLVNAGEANLTVLPTEDAWFGVTYAADKAHFQSQIRQRIAAGEYPENLWS